MMMKDIKSPELLEIISALRTYESRGAGEVLYEHMTSNRVPFGTIIQDFHTMSEREFLRSYAQDFRSSTPPADIYAKAKGQEADEARAREILRRIDRLFLKYGGYKADALVGACKALAEVEPGKAPMYAIKHAWENMRHALEAIDASVAFA